MFELLSVPKSACSFVRLNVSFRSDLLWWHTFLAPLNGINLTRTLAPLNFQRVRSGKTPQFWYIVITRVQWQWSILATARCKQSCTCCAACFMFGPDLNSTYEPFTFPESILCWPIQFLDLLFSQVPQAATSRIVLPPQLSALLVHSRPNWTSPHWTQLFGSCFPPA